MSHPSEKHVQQVLEPYHQAIHESIMAGWKDWWDSPIRKQTQSPRTRACFVWDRIVHHAKQKFAGNPSVHVFDKQGTTWFLFDSEVLLRFKKADATGLSSNIATQAALAFHDHAQDLLALPDVKRVEAVYSTNTLQTQVETISVVARNHALVAWKYDIVAGEAAEVIPLGTPKTPTPPAKLVTVLIPEAKPAKTNKE